MNELGYEVAILSSSGKGEALAQLVVTQAHMARWNASWEDATANGMDPDMLSKEDPMEAVKSGTWAYCRPFFDITPYLISI